MPRNIWIPAGMHTKKTSPPAKRWKGRFCPGGAIFPFPPVTTNNLYNLDIRIYEANLFWSKKTRFPTRVWKEATRMEQQQKKLQVMTEYFASIINGRAKALFCSALMCCCLRGNQSSHQMDTSFAGQTHWGVESVAGGDLPKWKTPLGSRASRDISRVLEHILQSLNHKLMPEGINWFNSYASWHKKPRKKLEKKTHTFQKSPGFQWKFTSKHNHWEVMILPRQILFPRFCFSISSFISFFLLRAASWKGLMHGSRGEMVTWPYGRLW